jgi:hypothetical protein
MRITLASMAAVALLLAGALAPTAGHAQDNRLTCDATVNTQHPPTKPEGLAVNTDRRAPCERIEGQPNAGASGAVVAAPPTAQPNGQGSSQ